VVIQLSLRGLSTRDRLRVHTALHTALHAAAAHIENDMELWDSPHFQRALVTALRGGT
jgi:hypothetical protein